MELEFDNLRDLEDIENEIKETKILLQETQNNKSKIKSLRFQRNLYSILSLLLFLVACWFCYQLMTKKKGETRIKNPNFISVHQDSLTLYKSYYLNSDEVTSFQPTLKDQEIIYSVQIGAFKNFKINSDELQNLKEFSSEDYQKYAIGNFTKYEEAIDLKKNLTKMGFKGSFIIAQSYGEIINDIEKALELSNETELIY